MSKKVIEKKYYKGCTMANFCEFDCAEKSCYYAQLLACKSQLQAKDQQITELEQQAEILKDFLTSEGIEFKEALKQEDK